MKSWAICGFLSNGTDMAFWTAFCTFRQEPSSYCNSKVHGPVCPKFNNSPSLNTSTCHYSVTAPHTGNRKWHVLDFDILRLAGSPDPPQMCRKDRKVLTPWWCFIAKIVSFHPMALQISMFRQDIQNPFWVTKDARKFTKLGTHIKSGKQCNLIWVLV